MFIRMKKLNSNKNNQAVEARGYANDVLGVMDQRCVTYDL